MFLTNALKKQIPSSLTLFLLSFTLLVGCGGDKGTDPVEKAEPEAPKETRAQILEKAIEVSKLELRGNEGEQLWYAEDKKTLFTGWVWEMVAGNGQQERERLYHFEDGKLNIDAEWYMNERWRWERHYKDGSIDSASSWKPDGSRCPVTNLKDGAGVIVDYYENGQELSEDNYKDGKVHGFAGYWWENGQRQYESHFHEGTIYGIDAVWDENGERVLEIHRLHDLEIQFVAIGDVDNAKDDTGYGAVGYEYLIGKHEISNSLIAAYNANRGSLPAIYAQGNTDLENHPACDLSWNEAARFVNWLNIDQGHQAAYKFTTDGAGDNIALWSPAEAWQLGGENLYRHKDAKYFLPSEDEWYKAAYYDGAAKTYFDYATGQNIGDEPKVITYGTEAGTAVYSGTRFYQFPADVTDAGGLSPYRTMAQTGNASEFTESAYDAPNDSPAEKRVERGGGRIESDLVRLQASTRDARAPDWTWGTLGFRVAAVPD